MRWDPNGKRLASASNNGIVQVFDFASEKATYTGMTVDDSKSLIVHVTISLIIYLLLDQAMSVSFL